MTNPYTDHAAAYRAAGWAGVLRLPLGLKTPPPAGYTGEGGKWPTNVDVEAWAEQGGNIALRLPADVVALDVDHLDAFMTYVADVGPLPPTWRSVGARAPGHLYFRLPAGVSYRDLKAPPGKGFDLLRHSHRYSIVWPSLHPDGGTYAWASPNGHLTSIPRPQDLPLLPAHWVEALKGTAPAPAAVVDSGPATWDQFTAGRAEIDEPIHGNHDDALAAYTASLVARGIDKAEALVLAMKRAEACVGGDPNRPFTERDFERWWRGAEAKFTPVDLGPMLAPAVVDETTGEATDPTPYDREVAREAMRLKVAQDARRRLLEAEAGPFPVAHGPWSVEQQLPEEPQLWAVDGLLPLGGNAVLTAQFKAGKTTTMLNLVKAYADGDPFLGRFDVEPATVALFNYEVGAEQMRRWARGAGIRNGHNLHLLHLRGHLLPLTSEYVQDQIVDWLAERGITTWVVDPLGPAMAGVDENSNTEVRRVLGALDEIKARAGVRDLVVTHHTGRGQESQGRARGATVVDDWPDARWILVRDDELGGARFFRASGRDVEFEETQLLFNSATRELTLGLGDRASLKAALKTEIKASVSNEAVVAILAANPGGLTQNAVCKAIGGQKEAAMYAVKGAVEAGLVTFRHVGNSLVYALPDGNAA